ncbi:MAG: cytochrome c oxidase assembly protein [Janthinobacterium lividum]
MLEATETIFREWRLPGWLTATILLTALVYVRGWVAIRRTRPETFTGIRLLSFLSGLSILWLAIASPMDGFADALLSAHMVEHLLLMSAVPPLLLLGFPVVPLLRGLPKILVQFVLAPVIRLRSARQFAHVLTRPIVAWLLMNSTFLAWHIPRAYDFALEHEQWHAIEHLCFLSTSLLFWWCLVQPWPATRHHLGWGILAYLVSADIVNTMLSAFLAFCDRPVYAFYLGEPNAFHANPLNDQILGAVLMWVFGSLAFLLPAVVITLRLARNDESEASVSRLIRDN